MSTTNAGPVYVMAGSDGRTWFYLLPHVEYDCSWHADGQPITRVPHQRASWWSHPGRASELVATGRPRRGRLLRHDLKDPGNASGRYPESLTPQEWERREAGESDVYQALYSPVHEQVEPGRWVFPASGFVDLGVGDPPPPGDKRVWVADVPYGLEFQPDLHHLFPGRLLGFRAHLRAALDAIPDVDAYDHGGFVVYVKLRFDPPVLHPVNRGRRVSKVESRITKEVRPSVPSEIRGRDRAEACRQWDEETERWVSMVRDFATVRVCAACQGSGVATPRLGEVASS